MRKERTENKARAPVGKRVRVLALQSFDDHSEGEQFEMEGGRELQKMITLGWVRLLDEHDLGT